MQKHLLIITVLSLLAFTDLKAGGSPPVSLSGTYLVGNSQPVYKKLTDVAAALNNAASTVTGNVIFELDSDYEGYMGETLPIVFNQFNSSGNWTVTIRPKAGVSMRKTSGDAGANEGVIKLDGADHIILDGRPGGTGTEVGWLIRNTRSGPGIGVYLLNDAQYNTLTWLQLETQSAGVYLASTTQSEGNDNNTISYCIIRDRTDVTGVPTTGILSRGASGDVAKFNSGNVITHNNIFNFTNINNFCYGINLSAGTTATAVTYNSIYQTRSFLSESYWVFNGINIGEAATSNTIIRDNFIGGSAPECAGAPLKAGGQGFKFNGIAFFAGSSTGTGNTAERNTIRNIDISSDVLSNSAVPFNGIQVGITKVDVINNTIGRAGGNDDIKITTNGSAFTCYMINFTSAAGGSIKGNTMGGITIDGNVTAANSIFYGIYTTSTPTNFEVSDNVIGSATVSNSIRAVSTTQPLSFTGIMGNVPDNGQMTYRNNTIAGVAYAYSGTSTTVVLTGIRTGGYYGGVIIDHNTISDITLASLAPAVIPTATFQAIWTNNRSSVISNNIIRRMRLTGTAPMNGAATYTSIVTGILANSWDASTVNNNKIYDLSSANDLGETSYTTLNGVIASGAFTIYNNLISLDNNSYANNCEITGIKTSQFPGSIKVFHNTVFIGGNNGVASHTASSSAISRKGAAGTYAFIKNNLLVNARTAGNGSHYIYYNDPVQASVYPATDWPSAVAANNVLVTATIGKIARWDTNDRDSTQWKTDGGDANSSFYTIAQLASSNLFADLIDLKIKNDALTYVKGKGISGTGITTDYTGVMRSTTAPTAGAYEYSAGALKNITVSAGALTPVFNVAITSYTDTVDYHVNSITLTPEAQDASVTITVNGTTVSSGNASAPITLQMGENAISLIASAPGIPAATYTITVVRKGFSLAGTFLVGNSQPVYKKLTDVAAALNNPGNIVTGDLVFELDSDYEGYMGETLPIVFNQFNTSGNWTVTIRPKAGVSMRKTSGDPGSNNSLIVLDGADRLILDGRAGGTGSIGWLIRNIAASSAGTVLLQNDAKHNTLTWLQLEGQSTATSGVVVLGASQTTGNDSNMISYCDVRNRSDVAGTMTCGILSHSVSGNISTSNSDNVITHNNILNFYSSGGAAYGIRLMGGTAMQITHNNFYQTQAITGAAARTRFYGVSIEQPEVTNTLISNNFIGGSAPGCTGDPFSVTGVNVSFTAIVFNSTGADAGAGNSADQNTIRNFDLIADAVSTEGVFTAIQSRTGRVDITNNTIGSSVDNDAIKMVVKGGSRRISSTIIILYSQKGGTVSGNTIGGITIDANPDASEAGSFTVISAGAESSATLTFNISNNLIGSTTLPVSIRSISATMPLNFTGISGNVYAPGIINYRNNTIAGIALSYSGTSVKTSMAGIVNGTSGSTATIDSNIVANVSSASLLPNLQPIVCGIIAVGNSIVSNNTVKGLRLTSTGPIASSSYGTMVAGIRTGDEVLKVYNNRIYDFSSVNGTSASSYTGLWGIEFASPCIIYNNIVSLDNGSNTNNCEIKGIQTNEFSSAAKVYHNTIYIGGTNGATSNTASSAPIGRPWSGGSYAQIRNNILVNARSGGSGAHYLYYNYTRSGNPATDWTTATSDNNLLVTVAMDKVARWGTTDLDSTQWKTMGGDQYSRFYTVSRIQPTGLFVNTATGNLAIKAGAQRYVAGKGIAGTGITTDLAMQDRSTTAPTLGVYEYPVPNNTAEPVITSHSGAASVSLQIPENTIAVTTVTATDADMTDVLTYSLVDEEDAGRFAVNPSTGELNFITAPDFEMPGDSNGDNIYIVTVQASDGELTATQRFKIKVVDANDHAPVITSYNGDISVSLRVEENTTAILATVKATDADKNPVITYSIADEEDGGKFSVNPATGELKFITAPDFDLPGDIGGDNIYIVTVKASDGDSTATQRFKIKVNDLNDNAPVFTSHNGNASVNLELPENTQAVTTIAAVDGDGTTVMYSMVNEDDGALFSLDASGKLSFATAPDFEHPADANHDNIYKVSVKASDGSLFSVQQFAIKITDLNDNLPMITTSMRVPENTIQVAELEATDADAGSSFTVETLNEEDGALFRINPATGWLEFRNAPDFEQPADSDHDNTYLVLIKISDNDLTFILRIKVKVTDIDESAGRSSNATSKDPEVRVERKTVAAETEPAPGKAVMIYPNPVTGQQFTLRMDSIAAGKYTLELYMLTGQLVYRQQLSHTGKPVLYPIQLPASLTRGMYVLRLAGEKTSFTEKLLVE